MRWFSRRKAILELPAELLASDSPLDVGPFATFDEFFRKLSTAQWNVLEGLIGRIDAYDGSFGHVEVVNPAAGELTLGFCEFAPITDELFALLPTARLRSVDDYGKYSRRWSERVAVAKCAADVERYPAGEALASILVLFGRERMFPGLVVKYLELGVMSALLQRVITTRP
ncbi:hypothetical protein [Mycobacterium sp. D16R24]|uniref:hypothetical protein n=1 Tax=Mycobacterium sp. D16R24 TaxID=1855656 RepID=UPI0009947545|nr:hypothetical protein [Mycobacterium sp. D16R24]